MQADKTGLRYPNGAVRALVSTARTEGLRALWRGVTPNMQRAYIVNAAELATYDHAKSILISALSLSPTSAITHVAASVAAGAVAALCSQPVDLVKNRLMNQAAATTTAAVATHSNLASVVAANLNCNSGSVILNVTTAAHLATATPLRATSVVAALPGLATVNASPPFPGAATSCLLATGRAPTAVGVSSAVDGGVRYNGMLDCAVKTVRAEGVAGLYRGILPYSCRIGLFCVVMFPAYEQLRALGEWSVARERL